MRRRFCLSLCLLSLAGTGLAQSSTDWPARPIKIVVPQPAGAGPDALARALGTQLERLLATPVVVENRPGANGNVAANAVLTQPADGYTLFLAGVSNMAWNPYLYTNTRYKPLRDFKGVALVAETPFITVVSPNLGVKTFAEWLKKAKEANPPMLFGSAGIGNSTHLAMELIAMRLGLKLQHVPFNGPGGYQSLFSGDVPVMTTVPDGSVGFVKSGKLVALAVTGDHRMAELPDVPTYKELGYDVQVPGWYSLVARAGTPDAIVEKVNQAVQQALEAPEMKQRLAGQFLQPMTGGPKEVERLTNRDSAQWGPIIRKLNIKS